MVCLVHPDREIWRGEGEDEGMARVAGWSRWAYRGVVGLLLSQLWLNLGPFWPKKSAGGNFRGGWWISPELFPSSRCLHGEGKRARKEITETKHRVDSKYAHIRYILSTNCLLSALYYWWGRGRCWALLVQCHRKQTEAAVKCASATRLGQQKT